MIALITKPGRDWILGRDVHGRKGGASSWRKPGFCPRCNW